MKHNNIKDYLDSKVKEFNTAGFIALDPVSIPHAYTKKQDIEIVAFWTAILAWGQRKTIINKANELFSLMGRSPYDFVLNHKEKDRKDFEGFKHRTFNYTDTLYFLDWLQKHYRKHDSLEEAFLKEGEFETMEASLIQFHRNFFLLEDAPDRTRKHIATPERNSSCKRLNMFLRWMVREDNNGVDFGIWKKIEMSQLMMPLDIHVGRVSRKLALLERKQNDWKAVEELTIKMRTFCPEDPVKYDFALFGMGINDKNILNEF